jgi:hypothetical protein
MRGFFVKNILAWHRPVGGLLIERRSIGLKGLEGQKEVLAF